MFELSVKHLMSTSAKRCTVHECIFTFPMCEGLNFRLIKIHDITIDIYFNFKGYVVESSYFNESLRV